MASIGAKMAKNSIIYILGKGLSIIISILLLPLYTSKIETSNYGYYDLVNTLIIYGVAILLLNISVAVLRFGYEENSDKKTLFSTSTFFTFFMSAIASIILLVINNFFTIKFLYFIIPLIFITGFNNLGGSFARCLNKNKLFAYSGIISSLLNAIIGITCVYVFKLQEEALFLALVFSHLAQAIILILFTKSFLYISLKNISFKTMFKMLSFSAPHAFSLLFAFMCKDVDKTIISSYLGDEMLGIFSMSLKYMGFITAIIDSLALAWNDTTFSISDKENRVASSVQWVNNITFLAAFVSVMFLPFIFLTYPILIRGDYQSAFYLIPILYISVFFMTCNGFYANSFLSEKKPIFLMLSRICAAVINLMTIFLLINKIGLFAIGVGYSLSSIFEFICSNMFSRLFLKMEFSVKSLLFFVPCYLLAALFFYFGNIYTNVIFTLLFVFAFYFVYAEKINKIIGSLFHLKIEQENLFFKAKKYFILNKREIFKYFLILLLNIISGMLFYLSAFLTKNAFVLALTTVCAAIIVFLNTLKAKTFLSKICSKNCQIYFVVTTLISWALCSIIIVFLNDKIYEFFNLSFGSVSFLLTIAGFLMSFFFPFMYMGGTNDE